MATKSAKPNAASTNTQVFTLKAPSAVHVKLAGDFTQWQRNAIGMQKLKDGFWRTEVELAPGTYHYRFLVDGEWRNDPACPRTAPNPFGGQDCVCQVD
jgi:1,4-alpha-glucan branching enzyme